jgi:hypothetical protein
MTGFSVPLRLIGGVALMAGAAALAGCAPAPVTRTVTEETTTTMPRPAPLVATTTTTNEVHSPALQTPGARRASLRRDRAGDIVEEETTVTGPAYVPAMQPVQSTTTRSTTQTIAPR